MSNKQRYYPNRTGAQMLWLRQFAETLPTYAATLGLPPDEVTEGVQDARWSAYVVGEWQPAARLFATAATQFAKDTEKGNGSRPLPAFIPPPLPEGVVERPLGALERVFKLVRRLKNRQTYTEGIGSQLGITITASQVAHDVPELKLRTVSGPAGMQVLIRYQKWGHYGLWLESRRGAGDWEPFPVNTRVPFRDDQPLLTPGHPEVREYRARYWDGGTPNGEWSAVARITVGV